MPINNGTYMGDGGLDVIRDFLGALKNGDAPAFWGLLDKKGQGYFIGVWFMALGDAQISTIEALSQEESFLNNALKPIMEGMKGFLGELLEGYVLSDISYLDTNHASVSLKSAGSPGREEQIPLVLELAGGSGAAALTCWKVDTLKCVNFTKIQS